jgi:hypothetical protein
MNRDLFLFIKTDPEKLKNGKPIDINTKTVENERAMKNHRIQRDEKQNHEEKFSSSSPVKLSARKKEYVFNPGNISEHDSFYKL